MKSTFFQPDEVRAALSKVRRSTHQCTAPQQKTYSVAIAVPEPAEPKEENWLLQAQIQVINREFWHATQLRMMHPIFPRSEAKILREGKNRRFRQPHDQ